MSFALSAIIIIILLLPGAVALKAYYTSLKEKVSTIHVPLNELLLNGLIISFITHASAVCVIRMFGYNIRFDFLYNMIVGDSKKPFSFNNKEFTTYFLEFCLYMSVLIISVWLSVKILRRIVRKDNYDLKYPILANTNYWFHIFNARYLEEKNIQGTQQNTDIIWVDALIENEIIYSGFLIDFNYSAQKDALENIVLRDAVKIICNHTTDGVMNNNITSDPHIIPGDIFVLPMTKMVNINLYYIKYEEDTEEELEYEFTGDGED